MAPKFRYRCTSFWAHWEWFLLLSSLSWKTEPVRERNMKQVKKKTQISFLTAVFAACTHSIGAVRPGNGPVHHPGDASLLTSLCQHLADSLTRCHAVGGSKLLLQRPLCGGTGNHRDGRAAGEHVCRHVVLRAGKLQPGNTGDTNMIKQSVRRF